MEIPKYVRKDGRRYKFVKKYPNFYLYADTETKTRTCFQNFDLGLISTKDVDRKLKPEKFKNF